MDTPTLEACSCSLELCSWCRNSGDRGTGNSSSSAQQDADANITPPSAAARRMRHEGSERPLRPGSPSYDEEHAIGSSSGCVDTVPNTFEVQLLNTQEHESLAQIGCTLTSA